MDDMNAFEQQIASVVQQTTRSPRPVDVASIVSDVATQSPKWRSRSLFGAAKFVVAGAIVGLFGGFLLAGMLAQPSDERLPAAATDSPDPIADLLPGVDLVTEEVEPGVYRISNDGVRDLAALDDPNDPYGDAYMLVVGQDDGVWMVGPDRDFFRLGDEASHQWTDAPVLVGDEDIEIAADGTTWSANEWRPDDHGKGMHLMAYDGASWTNEGWVSADGIDFEAWQVELGPDGTVWAVGSNGIHVREPTGWTRWATPTGGSFYDLFFVSDDGTRWFSGSPVWRDSSDWRDGDPTWEAIRPETPRLPRTTGTGNDQTAISPSGTLWMHLDGGTDDEPVLTRFDSAEWTSWTSADGVPPHIHTDSWWGHAMAASNDGSVWLAPGERDDDGGVCDGKASGSGGGVSRFDGTGWTHHLDGLCVHALAVTRDGTAWVRASRGGAVTDPVELYAIDPERVVAAYPAPTEPPPETATARTDTATRSDLLPGADLVTEIVEPGVLKVVNDGVRDLATDIPTGDVVVGEDDGVWRIGPRGEFFRLGVPGDHRWPDEPGRIGDEDIAVDAGGTLWSANADRPNAFGYQPDLQLMAYRDGEWSPAETYGRVDIWQVESGPTGVWALGGRDLYRVDEDGLTREPLPGEGALGNERASQLHIADDGSRWITSRRSPVRFWRARDGADGEAASWERVPVEPGEDLDLTTRSGASIESALTPSGDLWTYISDAGGTVRLGHLSDDGWSWWGEDDGVPGRIGTSSWWGDSLRAAGDGSIWLVSHQAAPDGGRCDQHVSRFDGIAWSHYLAGHCVHGIDVTSDGQAWVRARGGPGQAVEFYVITPEAPAEALK